ncbi:MAG: PAS domain-containing protein [Streptosporangiales bacterium]|nr:PAS domain-containing protein [Streptosporangiales bacterium]
MSATSNAAAHRVRHPRHAATGRLRLVESLHEVVASIGAGLDLDTVLTKICASAADLLDADLGVFLRLDGAYWRPVVVGGAPDANWGAQVALEDDWVTQLVRDNSDWCAFPVDNVSPVMIDIVRTALPGAGSAMAVAARTSATTHGALAVVFGDSKRTPEPAEIDVLMLLAQHAGIALSNADSSAEMIRDRKHQHVIIDATTDGLAVLDGAGRVLQWNSAAERLTGRSSEEAAGKPPPFPISEPGQVLDHRLPTGRWVEILSSRVPDSDDVVVEFRDVSQAKELERARDVLLSTTAHELRTPVTAIRGFSSTLLQRWDDLSDAGRRAAVEVVADRSTALASLVDKVVLGVTVSGEEPELVTEPVDLATTLGEILSAFPQPADGRRLVFDVSQPCRRARCDRRALPEVVNELLENAVKFSPDGGDVAIRVWDDGTQVGFSVRDQGIGIADDDLPHVFDLFYQGGTGDRRRFGGLGLGLYIVRQLVRAQHGAVTALRPADGGTEVTVRLPYWETPPVIN